LHKPQKCGGIAKPVNDELQKAKYFLKSAGSPTKPSTDRDATEKHPNFYFAAICGLSS